MFKLNGKPFSVKHCSPASLRLKAFLEKLPDNELLDTRELAKRVGGSARNITSNLGNEEDLRHLRAKVRYPSICVVWGNRRTISELRKHKELVIHEG